MKAVKKSTSVVSEIETYLTYYKNKIEEVNYVITGLDGNISDLKKEIKNVENDLKKQLDTIATKNKEINSKLHDVSGDYDETYLITAAEELKELKENKAAVESEFKDKLDDLNDALKGLENDKSENVEIRQKIVDINSLAEKELKDTIKTYAKVLDTIEKAINVCDNPNLKIALDEETSAKESTLENISNRFKDEVDNILDIRETKPIIKPKEQEEVKEEFELPKIDLDIETDNNEDLFQNKNVVEIDYSSHDEFSEPEKADKEEKSSNLNFDLPDVTINTEEETDEEEYDYDEDRKVIDIKDISEEQRIAIENSSIVEKGLKNFFN